jgi:palmitoyltransferase ZDHHC1/11
MRTYDYILAMREAGKEAFDPFEDSDSDESIDFDSPERPSFMSRTFCRKDEGNEVRKDKFASVLQRYQYHWLTFLLTKLIWNMTECSEAVDQDWEWSSYWCFEEGEHPDQPMDVDKDEQGEGNGSCWTCSWENQAEAANVAYETTATRDKARPIEPGAEAHYYWEGDRASIHQELAVRVPYSKDLQPQEAILRFTVAKARSKFDMRLAEVSRELDTHISKQVLCSVVMKGVEEEGSSSWSRSPIEFTHDSFNFFASQSPRMGVSCLLSPGTNSRVCCCSWRI